MITTIQVDDKLKKELDSFKEHHRETYNELLLRILKTIKNNRGIEKENFVETIEILSNPETMRNLAESLEDINNSSKWTSWETVKKNNGL